MGFRVSVDTGGTFTDVVVADEDGTLLLAKAPTDVTRAFQSIEEGLAQTVAWYRENEWWWRPIKEQDAAYKAYYQAQYAGRRTV